MTFVCLEPILFLYGQRFATN